MRRKRISKKGILSLKGVIRNPTVVNYLKERTFLLALSLKLQWSIAVLLFPCSANSPQRLSHLTTSQTCCMNCMVSFSPIPSLPPPLLKVCM